MNKINYKFIWNIFPIYLAHYVVFLFQQIKPDAQKALEKVVLEDAREKFNKLANFCVVQMDIVDKEKVHTNADLMGDNYFLCLLRT